MSLKKNQPSAVRRLHRSFGVGAAAFVIFMVLSGLAINHTNALGLDQRHVSQSVLLSWYGLDGPEQIHSFAVGNDWLSFAGSQLYLNGASVSTILNGVGAVSSGDMLIAAGGDELLLLDLDGNLIERLPWDIPGAGPIESIGSLADGTVVLKSANQLWLADSELLNWKQNDNVTESPSWSSAESAPQVFEHAITRQYRGDGLSLERLLLDFHSGRVFGPMGVFVYDLLALTVGFLAISGLAFWVRGRRNGKRNGKN